MQHYTIRTKGESYARVSKAYARKHYKTELIAICPVKLRPAPPWAPHCYLDLPSYKDMSFDSIVSTFIFYNCANNETGYYPAFYKVIQH